MATDVVITLNNLAVAQLRANNIIDAKLLCIAALEREHSITSEGRTPEEGHLPAFIGTSVVSRVDEYMLLLDPDERHEIEEATSFIYRTGIAIPAGETDPSVITPILVFNTALTHHMLAEQYSACAHYHLQKAYELYELALRSQDTDTNLLFEFAILNNLGMIHREIGAEPTANVYFGYLLSAWMMFLDQQSSLRMRHVRGFLLNLPTGLAVAVAA